MKIKEIQVGAKKVKHFQGYEVKYTIVIEKGDDPEALVAEYQAKCRKATLEQIKIDEKKRM